MTKGLFSTTTQALIDTGYCWWLGWVASLELDDESRACGMDPPKAHWRVEIIMGLEDQVTGWGDTPDEAAADALSEMDGPSDEKFCDCFGDSGLHASTHVPADDDREHCDLCGHPIQPESVDTLTAINQPGD
jgi:hypothetical protein